MGEEEPGFDVAKAEMFEAVGHPIRLKIIQTLGDEAAGFAELKKKVGLESSGHLAFHLGKLHHLVGINPEGKYALTGEGKEAMRMIQTVKERVPQERHRYRWPTGRALVGALLVAVVALSFLAAFQQAQLIGLSAPPPGAVVLGGKSYFYSVIPYSEIRPNRQVSFVVDGVNFTMTQFLPWGSLSVHYANGSLATVAVTVVGTNNTGQKTFAIALVAIPDVQVRFPDGTMETLNFGSVQSRTNPPLNSSVFPYFPWYSVHTNPRAAISENSTAITLYVSTGR